MAFSVELSLINIIICGALIFVVKKLTTLFQKWKTDKMLEKYNGTPKDKVILHTVWRCKGIPSISPYALKLETYLRMAKIPYELETKDPMGPKGKLPWITYNGQHIADSHLIIQFLNKKLGINLNKNHSDEVVSVARACRVLLEEHFMWGIVQYRWIENASSLPNLMKIPTIFKLFLPLNAYQIEKRMISNGMGKHTPTEIYQMTEDDLRTISLILGEKAFLGGDEPCEEDAGIFGAVSQAIWGMPGSSFERLAFGELSNLKAYCERMRDRYWPDWEECQDKS